MTLWIESRDGDEDMVRLFMAALRQTCAGNTISINWSSRNYKVGGHGEIVFTTLDNVEPQCVRLWELSQSTVPVVFRLRGPGEEISWSKDDWIVHKFRDGVKARDQFGFTKSRMDAAGTALEQISIVVEPTFNRGLGYYVFDINDEHIPEPLHVVIAHETNHAWEAINGIFHDGEADEDAERSTLAAENDYRRLRGMPERWGHEGGYNEPSWIGNPGCFIATAAYGSPSDPAVRSLRAFRDDVLLNTRHGNAYFDEFYAKYYRLSPAIVQIMHADAEFASMVRDTLVAPIVGYLDFARTFPRADLDGVPEPWRGYLVSMRETFADWTAAFPLPKSFAGIPASDAAFELLVTMNTQLWRQEAVDEYIADLERTRALPLAGSAEELRAVAEGLTRNGVRPHLVAAIVGSTAWERGSGGIIHIEHGETLELVNSATGYFLRLGNGLPTAIPMVHVKAARTGSEPTLHRIPNFQPGAEVMLPLGTIADVGFYEIALYDADGHMAGHAPAGLAAYSRREGQSNGMVPLSETCDGVVLGTEHLIALDSQYSVTVFNNTPDTWDSVDLTYGSTVEGTVLLESSAVGPQGKATFLLGEAQYLQGYSFSIFVDGLRAKLWGEALQLPPDGLMTAERAVEFSSMAEIRPTDDYWTIGKES